MPVADRTYMRNEAPGRRWSPTIVVLIINALVFLVENSDDAGRVRTFEEYGALSLEGLKHGYVWQFFTYQFLHGSLAHLLINSLALFFFGRPLEMVLGRGPFVRLYFLSGIAGGVLQILLGLIARDFNVPTVGASAGICGLVAAFALLHPDSTIYLFFVIPVRARYLLPGLLILSCILLFTSRESNIAHGAHVGGLIFGILYLRWDQLLHLATSLGLRLPVRRQTKALVKVRFPRVASASARARKETRNEEAANADFISKEVDPILEKISAHGIHSLTERERKILEAARSRMEKR